MRIFIDESGTFTGYEKPGSLSVCGALVICDSRWPHLRERWLRLRQSLPKENGEVKGRLLSEAQVRAVVSLLHKHDALFEVTAVDVGLHSSMDVRKHQEAQAAAILRGVGPDHHPNVRGAMEKLHKDLLEMPAQLYLQAVAMFELVPRTFDLATVYWSQRRPRELARFRWTIDAKDKQGSTPWEDWWRLVLLPLLQSKSLRKPGTMLREGDYSHFKAFLQEVPDYIRPHIAAPHDDEAFSLNRVLRDLHFCSRSDPGLELVDVVTTSVRRALKGTLKKEGWLSIRALMINRVEGAIQLIGLNGVESARVRYADVVTAFGRTGRSLLAARNRKGCDT